jgi:hypothetical protein
MKKWLAQAQNVSASLAGAAEQLQKTLADSQKPATAPGNSSAPSAATPDKQYLR